MRVTFTCQIENFARRASLQQSTTSVALRSRSSLALQRPMRCCTLLSIQYVLLIYCIFYLIPRSPLPLSSVLLTFVENISSVLSSFLLTAEGAQSLLDTKEHEQGEQRTNQHAHIHCLSSPLFHSPLPHVVAPFHTSKSAESSLRQTEACGT